MRRKKTIPQNEVARLVKDILGACQPMYQHPLDVRDEKWGLLALGAWSVDPYQGGFGDIRVRIEANPGEAIKVEVGWPSTCDTSPSRAAVHLQIMSAVAQVAQQLAVRFEGYVVEDIQ